MGYRSEVAFVVPADAPRFEKETEDGDVFDTIVENDGFRLYSASWLKWYEDYPIVQAVENYLSDLRETEKDDDFLFIRIGEDAADVDEEGSFYSNPFNLGWVRKIEFDGAE